MANRQSDEMAMSRETGFGMALRTAPRVAAELDAQAFIRILAVEFIFRKVEAIGAQVGLEDRCRGIDPPDIQRRSTGLTREIGMGGLYQFAMAALDLGHGQLVAFAETKDTEGGCKLNVGHGQERNAATEALMPAVSSPSAARSSCCSPWGIGLSG